MVDEDSPQVTYWARKQLVSDGPFHIVDVQLFAFSDPERDEPPLYPEIGWPPHSVSQVQILTMTAVKRLVMLAADISTIPMSRIPVRRGKDGLDYFMLNFQIRVAFFSAHTEYSLWYKGNCYGSVDAEYA